MRSKRWMVYCGAMPALLLSCGCLPLQWTTDSRIPPAEPPAAAAAPAPAGQPPVPPGQVPAGQVALRQVAYQEPSSQQAADLAQKLGEIRDENKVLAARLQEFQVQLEEKSRAVTAARSEVRVVTNEIKLTREEIERWSREVANLRERAQVAEKENQASLKTLTHLVEMMIEQETARLTQPPVKAPPPTAPTPAVPNVP